MFRIRKLRFLHLKPALDTARCGGNHTVSINRAWQLYQKQPIARVTAAVITLPTNEVEQ